MSKEIFNALVGNVRLAIEKQDNSNIQISFDSVGDFMEVSC